MSKNIAILASGNGTNAENIIRYFQNSESVNVKLVLADRETAFVLERARRLNVPFACLDKAAWADGTVVLSLLEDKGIDFIVLAGFLARVPDCILHAYPNKIINIHPSLLPKFGGKGMYGGHVHEAVVAAGETETGITIHYLNEHFDEGEIIVQYKCPVLPQQLIYQIEALKDKTYYSFAELCTLLLFQSCHFLIYQLITSFGWVIQ